MKADDRAGAVVRPASMFPVFLRAQLTQISDAIQTDVTPRA